MPTRSFSSFESATAEDREQVELEESDEAFDRMAFAQRALDLVRLRRTRVVLCEGHARVRVDHGRSWGKGAGARWAVLSVPRRASRRAIALAVAQLSEGPPGPWALDVLLQTS
jgi:hypothetical protein